MNLWIPFWSVVGLVVLGIIALCVRLYFMRKARLKREAPIREWIDGARRESYSSHFLAEFADPPEGYEALPEAVKLASQQATARERRAAEQAASEQRQAEVRAEFETMRRETNKDKLYEWLCTFNSKLSLEEAEQEWCTAQLKELTDRHAGILLEQARNGNFAAFIELRNLTDNKYIGYEVQTGSAYETPADWDLLVTDYYRNPKIGDFRFVRSPADVSQGSVRLLAAEALRRQSLKLAKIVLAYCVASPVFQAEVGTMAAELAKLVDAIHTERGMFPRTVSQSRS